MNTIYLYRERNDYNDAPGLAYDEEGKQLSFHVSSSRSWFQQDMRRGHHRKLYEKRYPDGYVLVEVIGLEMLQTVLPMLTVAPLVDMDKYEIPTDDPIPEDLRLVLNDIAGILNAAISEHAKRPMGFMLMTFDIGEKGTTSYISNVERDGVIKALEEFIGRQ